MIDLHWTVPQTPSNDTSHTGGKFFLSTKKNSNRIYMHQQIHLDEVKSNLKSAYKELEKIPKSQVNLITNIMNNIIIGFLILCILFRQLLRLVYQKTFVNMKMNII